MYSLMFFFGIWLPFSFISNSIIGSVISSSAVSTSGNCSVSWKEYLALYDLYTSTNGENWKWIPSPSKSIWTFTLNGSKSADYSDPCFDNWQGLKCSTSCEIKEVQLNNHGLVGMMPYSISDLQSLQILDLNTNKLYGSIPSSIFSISTLQSLSLQVNALTGTIPSPSIANLNFLRLDLSENFLNGSLPNDLALLSNLRYLRLRFNTLTGPIRLLEDFPHLEYINMRSNPFSGEFPQGLPKLVNLSFFALAYTKNIYGKLPDDIGSLEKMRLFAVQGNQLTGTIPASVGMWANKANTLYFSDNNFIGTLPQSFESFTKLVAFWVQNNHLTGTIPKKLIRLQSMITFLAQGNSFGGNINELLADIGAKLGTLDLSDNKLTGSIPANLFSNSSLSVIGFAQNCLHGAIPDIICSAKKLTQLIANSLSLRCSGASMMTGSIPQCIFSMPNIESIYLSGNSLRGELPNDVLISSPKLVNISVSYNNMEGTIPYQMMNSKFSVLDLSNNKFTGQLNEDGIRNNQSRKTGTKSSLSMKVNRLSGPIPYSSAVLYDHIDILTGNLFDCESKVPSDDQGSMFFECGSRELDNSIYFLAFGSALAFVYILFSANTSRRYLFSYLNIKDAGYLKDLYGLFEQLNTWHSSLALIPLSCVNTRSFIRCSRMIKCVSVISALFIILISIVVYPSLKSLHSNTTHYIQYNWYISMAFLIGINSAIVILFVWILCSSFVVLCIYLYHKSVREDRVDFYREQGSKRNQTIRDMLKKYGRLFLVCAINTTIVTTINVGYVVAKFSVHSYYVAGVQFSLALFKLLWNVGAVGGLIVFQANNAQTTVLQSMRLRLFLLVINSIVAPLVATILTDSRCFYEILNPPEATTLQYVYPYCATAITTNNDITCIEWTPLISTFTTHPPFIYSGQCTSALLTNYIPIVMYVYVLIALAVPVVFVVATTVGIKNIPAPLISFAPGMLWPHRSESFRYMLRADLLMVSQLLHLTILLTFGIASPALACTVGLVILSELYFNELFLGRYLYQLKQLHGSLTDEKLATLEVNCCDVWRFPKFCIWMIVIISAIFIGFAAIDFSSDAGFSAGAAIATVSIVYSFILWIMAKRRFLERAFSENSVENFLYYIMEGVFDGPTTSSASISASTIELIAENPLTSSSLTTTTTTTTITMTTTTTTDLEERTIPDAKAGDALNFKLDQSP